MVNEVLSEKFVALNCGDFGNSLDDEIKCDIMIRHQGSPEIFKTLTPNDL
jgi:hypothetical protein